MESTKPLTVGIVGAGGIARNHHVPSYLRCENVDVVAACDISKAALDQMRSQHGIPNLYTDYRDLLARDDLDLISVCTSNNMHYPIVMDAIDRGLDIFCEKPLALDLDQAKEMCQAAQEHGTKTGVNFSHRRTPASQLAKELLASGALGKIHYVSAVYAAGNPNYADRPATWRNDKELAGFGGMGDMGSHILDMMMWWLDSPVTSVACQMQTIVPTRADARTGERVPITTEDQGLVLMSYANGALGYLCGGYCFTGRSYDQRIEVYGSTGGLMYNQKTPNTLDVYLDEGLEQYEVLRQAGSPENPYATIHVPERLQGREADGKRRTILMDFVDAYRAEGAFQFSPGFCEGLQVQEALEACKRGDASRCWIDLPLQEQTQARVAHLTDTDSKEEA